MAKACIDVYVKLPTGKNSQFDLLPSDTIGNLCNEIAKKENWESRRIKIKYQGKVLKKTSTLGYLGVVAETILKAEIIQPQDITVRIKAGATTKKVTISNFDTTKDLVDEVEKTVDLNNKYLKTKSGAKISPGPSTIDEIGIYDGEEFTVTNEETSPDSKSTLNHVDLDEIKSSFDAQGKNVEVAFSFDTTGSMYACLDTVRSNLEKICRRLLADIPNIRISLIAHGDYCDQSVYVIKMVDLTSNVQELVSFAKDVPKTSGGDTPECYEWVLKKAQNLDWAEDSAKALVMIGDSPPHPVHYTDQLINWHDELDILTGMGIKVYGVHAGNSTESKQFYQELADRSGGSYLPLGSFDVITDMFLAVCYNESNENHLDQFVQEMEDAGEMTCAKQEMIENIKSAQNPEEKKAKRERKNLSYDWWNSTVSSYHGPRYYYNVQKDFWSSNSSRTDTPVSTPSSADVRMASCHMAKSRRSFRAKFGKGSCAVM